MSHFYLCSPSDSEEIFWRAEAKLDVFQFLFPLSLCVSETSVVEYGRARERTVSNLE